MLILFYLSDWQAQIHKTTDYIAFTISFVENLSKFSSAQSWMNSDSDQKEEENNTN